MRRRWNWPVETALGTRRRSYLPLTICAEKDSLTLVLGWNRGTRSDGRPLSGARWAHRVHRAVVSAGGGSLDQFLGPVAGVHLDHLRGTVTVWRDRFGRIPIQMIRLPVGWAVTTCPTTTAHLADPAPRREHLLGFLADDRATDDRDALRHTRRIRPAEWVQFDASFGLARRHLWWNPALRECDPLDGDRQFTDRLHQLGTHVGRQPHILALSAGLDSAALAALATRGHPGSETITFVDGHARHNEGPQAAALAAYLGLRWTPFAIDHHGPLTEPTDHRSPRAWGPAGHPDMAWKMPCHRWLQRRRPDLPLVYGNGADDLLWVPTDLWLRDRWRHADLAALWSALPHLSPSQILRPGLGHLVDRLHLRPWRARLPTTPPPLAPWQQPQRWIDDPLPTSAPPAWPPTRRHFHLRLWRLQTWRWERAMRSLALESRRARRPILTPFLDAPLWELGLSLSPGHLVEGGRQKAILRRAVADLLPADCRRRPKIGGFDPVVERGLAHMASHRVYALVSQPRLAGHLAFDPAAFLQAFEAYRRAPGCDQANTYRGSWAIWKTLAAEYWLRQ